MVCALGNFGDLSFLDAFKMLKMNHALNVVESETRQRIVRSD